MQATKQTSLKYNIAWFIFYLFLLSLCGSCSFPGSTKPVIKIGLIAPFEGELRHHGYQRLYGVKLALEELNRAGGVAGYKIALVALNDDADLMKTKAQAQALVIDPDVRAIIGNWDQTLYQATQNIYTQAQLTVIQPHEFVQFSTLSANFDEQFQVLSGSLPSEEAQQGYLATWHLIRLIEETKAQFGRVDRVDIWTVAY